MENKEDLPKEEKISEVLKSEQADVAEIVAQKTVETQQTHEAVQQVPAISPVLPALPSKKAKQKMSVTDKFGVFFIIIGFIAMLFAFLPLVSALFLALYYVILVLILILSFLTLLFNEDFQNWLNGGERVSDILQIIIPYCPYVFGGAIGMFAISLTLFCFSKHKSRKIAGIALNILFMVLSGIGMGLILYFTNSN